jgi:hypothetical protein
VTRHSKGDGWIIYSSIADGGWLDAGRCSPSTIDVQWEEQELATDTCVRAYGQKILKGKGKREIGLEGKECQRI